MKTSPYGVPGMLRIDLARQWLPYLDQSWARFRRSVMEEVEQTVYKYRRESMAKWANANRHARGDLQLLARYQANEIRNPDESEYQHLRRTAEQLGLTLRPKNKRTKQS